MNLMNIKKICCVISFVWSLEVSKLMYGVRYPEIRGEQLGTEMGHNGVFRGGGNVLSLDLGGSYLGVFTLRKFIEF